MTISYSRRSSDSIACGYSGSSGRNVRAVGRTPLQERRPRMAGGEAPLRPARVVDGGVDVGFRPGVAERREDALGPAEVEQEVVDERDACGHEAGECMRVAGPM